MKVKIYSVASRIVICNLIFWHKFNTHNKFLCVSLSLSVSVKSFVPFPLFWPQMRFFIDLLLHKKKSLWRFLFSGYISLTENWLLNLVCGPHFFLLNFDYAVRHLCFVYCFIHVKMCEHKLLRDENDISEWRQK